MNNTLIILFKLFIYIFIFNHISFVVGQQKSVDKSLYGYIDIHGHLKIKPIFYYAYDFSCGLASVNLNDNFLFINKEGKNVLDSQSDNSAIEFHENLIYFFVENKKGNNKYGYMDKKGQILIKPIYDRVKNFSEDLAAVQLMGKGWGFINKIGKVIIEPKVYVNVYDFSEGLAAVQTYEDWEWDKNISNEMMVKKMKWGFINKKGELVINDKFCEVKNFSEGLALVSVGCYFSPEYGGEKFIRSKYGYINKKGKYVIKPKFRWAGSFSEGLAAVLGDNGCGFINKKGKEIIKFKFKDVGSFKEGLAAVLVDKKWGFINRRGEIAICPMYNNVRSFSHGYAAVEVDGLWGYIDKAGNYLVEPKFLEAYQFSEGLARIKVAVEKNEK